MKIATLFLLFFLTGLLSPLSVDAQENWVINNFRSDVKVLDSGDVNIVETLEVDFGSAQKHGIFRDVPYVYTASDGAKTYTDIHVTGVTDGLIPVLYETNTSGDFVQVKIGDPKVLVSGRQIYEIKYTVTGILRSYDSYDELYWNATGNRWEVPIQQASATVSLPSPGIIQSTCYQGVFGSRQTCKSGELNKTKSSFFSTGSLSPSEGFTVVVGYKKGLVPIPNVQPPASRSNDYFSPLNLVVFILVSALGLLIPAGLWWMRGRDYWVRKRFIDDPHAKHEVKPVGAHETIVVEYSPPENLRPAEIGTLMDEKADTLDVTATIIDLATRGHLKISEIPKKWVFGSTDYEFTRLQKDSQALLDYEKELLDRIFDDASVTKISDLKTKFYKDLKKVKESLYKDVVSKRFFYESPDKTRSKYGAIGFIMWIFGGGMIWFNLQVADLPPLFYLAGGIVIAGGVTMIFSFFMPRRTAYGREMYRRSKGYELFVTKTEKYRQRFFEKKDLFNEVLPYAIVFGATEKFAKAFKNMGIEPQQPSWYTGTRPFNAAVFGASMASFSSSFGTAIASTPGGSGFSGGSAGGGFGGGGGGSW